MLATMIWGVLLCAGALALVLPPTLLVLRSVRTRLGCRTQYHDPVQVDPPARPFMPMVVAANCRTNQAAGDKCPEAVPAEPTHEVRCAA